MEKNITKKALRLEGMTCTSCEMRIENELRKTEGVREAKASYKTQILAVSYDEARIRLKDIIKAIEALGYDVKGEVRESEIPGSSKDVKSAKSPRSAKSAKSTSDKKSGTGAESNAEKNPNHQLVIIGILILGLYLIIKNTIGFNFIPEVSPNMGYAVLFAVGLLTSLHCVAMCGGINLSVCISGVSSVSGGQDSSRFSKLAPSFLYNTGRVVSYTVIGGIVGALGSVFSISNAGSAFISILAGIFMVIMGLNMLNIFPRLRKLNPHMPKAFAGKIHSGKKNKGPFVVGLLNGLMPCGPLQAMQLYALGTGSFVAGALSMFAFSLGTVPLLFAFGAVSSFLSARFTKKMLKASAMLVIVLGFAMVSRGFAFAGIAAAPSPVGTAATENSDANTAQVSGEVQEIETVLEPGSYPPLTVQAGIPVKWTILAEPGSLNGCNNKIVMPEYGIEQKLYEGENVITFIPEETGRFGYSCWMGMIRSSITVTEGTQGDNGAAGNEGTTDPEGAADAEGTTDAEGAADAEGTADTEDPAGAETPAEIENTGLPAGCCDL
ncbi:urease accessory protein UreH domain-containing protein [Anaerobium acetethylicum]|uniref:Sulfite exporter TauE/SafE n=1 Tax=Anaerobium acetethylicum TaxID=1619234 RepID=A0A1D3TWI1_9FIRM|nr:sulfite exporter TauE/SafE family protein [Anaerobium acetethylicum]SCP98561.1 Sulfite exporter TauE/SafE [Anaerobium acetethylicum]